MSRFSLVIGQNANRQLVTSSEKLVASAQFLVTLATSESQFQALSLIRYDLYNTTFLDWLHCLAIKAMDCAMLNSLKV